MLDLNLEGGVEAFENRYRPFSEKPDSGNLMQRMDMIGYMSVVQDAETREQAVADIIAVGVKNAKTVEEAAAHSEHALSFLPFIEEAINEEIQSNAMYLAVDIATAIHKRSRIKKSMRKSQKSFPIYLGYSTADGQRFPALTDAKNMYLVSSHPAIKSLIEVLRAQTPVKATYHVQACLYKDSERDGSKVYETMQACVVVTFKDMEI